MPSRMNGGDLEMAERGAADIRRVNMTHQRLAKGSRKIGPVSISSIEFYSGLFTVMMDGSGQSGLPIFVRDEMGQEAT